MDPVITTTNRESIHQRLERERKSASKEAALLRDFRAYALGQQRGTLTTAQQRILRGVTGRRFCDNVCKMVLMASTSRLQLARYDVANTEVESYLRDVWTLQQLPALSNQVHWATLRDGNHAVALSWDNEAQRVRYARERWWDGKSGIFISYDERQGQPQYAVKEWRSEVGQRRVVWFSDRIERYIAGGDGGESGWRGYALDSDNPDSWRSAWVDSNGQPLGLPVVHFRNISVPNDSTDAEVDNYYGLSDLDGGVLGLQDEINDVQRDITAGGRYTGYQMLYGTGVKLEEDGAGNKIPLRVEPGAVFTSEEAASRFGTLPAGDLSQLVNVLVVKLQAVSRMTATPLHMITNDWPSGEALLRAEQPLIAKVEALANVFGPTWASLAHKTTMLANTYGGQALDTEAMISTVFMPPDRADPLTLARVAQAVSNYVSEEEVLRILGYAPDNIKKIMRERKGNAGARLASAPAVQSQAQEQEQGQGQGQGSELPLPVPTPVPTPTRNGRTVA